MATLHGGRIGTSRDTKMLKHPEELGFTLGLIIRIGEPASIRTETPDASKVRDIVYVALLAENRGPLEKGDALKIGQTKGSLMGRWGPIAAIFQRGNLRNNEKDDRTKWLKVANGKEVSLWMRAAGKFEIPYAKGLTRSLFSIRGAEEEFLDQYYQPKLGIPLNRLTIEVTDDTN
jgi:hypothetical protein